MSNAFKMSFGSYGWISTAELVGFRCQVPRSSVSAVFDGGFVRVDESVTGIKSTFVYQMVNMRT